MKIYYVATILGSELANVKAFSSVVERKKYLKNLPIEMRKSLVTFEGDK